MPRAWHLLKVAGYGALVGFVIAILVTMASVHFGETYSQIIVRLGAWALGGACVFVLVAVIRNLLRRTR